jgi:fructosamine-3-kinase
MITPTLQVEVEKALGRRITSVAPLSAANNAQIYRIMLEDKRVIVAKIAERGLDTEAFMLKYLKAHSRLPIPEVYYGNEHLIVMEFVPGGPTPDSRVARHAAELLADLHNQGAETYGFERDTLIGALRQPNPQEKDWAKFFAEQRLLFMAGEAHKEHKVDDRFMKGLEKLCARLPDILKDAQKPSLIHGDIWGGNVLSGNGRVTAFVDPAIYYADAEVELAFIRLFNTFDESFFAKYNELRPIRPGFYEERADIYNIYPLLVHTRLFGASYARKAQKIIDRFS